MRVSVLPRNVTSARFLSRFRSPVHNLQSAHLRCLSTRASTSRRRPRWPWLFAAGAVGTATWVLFSLWEFARSNTRLHPDTFSQYIIADRVPVSSTSSIFTLTPFKKNDTNPSIIENLFRECLWSIQIKQPQLQIAREYTPLPLGEEEKRQYGNDAFRLLIRKEEQGEVSGWLHRLPTGAKIDIRGPRTVQKIPDGIEEILFLAGGTGIAPALQLAHVLLASRTDSRPLPRLRILWANRRRDDCAGGVSTKQQAGGRLFKWWPRADNAKELGNLHTTTSVVVEQLEQLKEKFEGQFEVDYFVDEERSFITQRVLTSALVPQATPSASGVASTGGKRLIIVSGPDGFVAHFAGAKELGSKHETPGELHGLLKDAGAQGWEVWKL